MLVTEIIAGYRAVKQCSFQLQSVTIRPIGRLKYGIFLTPVPLRMKYGMYRKIREIWHSQSMQSAVHSE